MSLPDNFTGALLLSVVDFFLSFVFISFIGIAVMRKKNMLSLFIVCSMYQNVTLLLAIKNQGCRG